MTTSVCDLFYPSPPSLKQLASISAGLELCRCRQEKLFSIEVGDDHSSGTLVADLEKHLPGVLCAAIVKYTFRLRASITEWFCYHTRYLKLFDGIDVKVLKNFSYLVYDFDGHIHYGKTAKRMMLCNGIGDDVKFCIACLYCFEEDVLRIWPSMPSRMNIQLLDNRNDLKFEIYPQVRYWICRLTNQPFQMLIYRWMNWSLPYGTYFNLQSIEYFWNDERFSRIKLFNSCYKEVACRHLLAKLDENELNEIVNIQGVEIIFRFISHSQPSFENESTQWVLMIWAFIKTVMNERNFHLLVWKFFEQTIKCEVRQVDYASLWYEIWHSAPHHLKQTVIQRVQRDVSFFLRKTHLTQILDGSHSLGLSCLLSILSDMSMKERKTFWLTNWRYLMVGAKPAELRYVMKLCLADENEMHHFEENYVYTYENIRAHGAVLLQQARLEQLEQFLASLYLKEKKIREIRLKLLNDSFNINYQLVDKAYAFSKFINDAYDNVELANNFKIDLLHSLISLNLIKLCLNRCKFRTVMQFVDTFAVFEENVILVKKSLVALAVLPMLSDIFVFGERGENIGTDLVDFLKWCLVNDDENMRFKQTINIDDLFEAIIRKKNSVSCRIDRVMFFFTSSSTYARTHFRPNLFTLNAFLEWYFGSGEAVKEFRRKQTNKSIRKMITK